jgi:hypothetical protein
MGAPPSCPALLHDLTKRFTKFVGLKQPRLAREGDAGKLLPFREKRMEICIQSGNERTRELCRQAFAEIAGRSLERPTRAVRVDNHTGQVLSIGNNADSGSIGPARENARCCHRLAVSDDLIYGVCLERHDQPDSHIECLDDKIGRGIRSVERQGNVLRIDEDRNLIL